jgi:hypothetical protein
MRASEHLVQGQSLDHESVALLIFIGILGFVLFWGGRGTALEFIGAFFMIFVFASFMILVTGPSCQRISSKSNVISVVVCVMRLSVSVLDAVSTFEGNTK